MQFLPLKGFLGDYNRNNSTTLNKINLNLLGENMRIIEGILGLIFFVYICFLPVYFIFYNSSEDAVEELSLESNSKNFIKMESKYGSNMSKSETSSFLDELEKLKKIYAKKGIDISKPLYTLLKEDKDVSDLRIIDNSKEEFGIFGSLISQYAGAKLFTITWRLGGRQYEIPVMVIPPSFFKMRRAIAWTTEQKFLQRIYGV